MFGSPFAPSFFATAVVILVATASRSTEALRPSLSPLCHAHQTATTAGVRISEAIPAAKGLGAFATRRFAVGDYVGEYYGEFLTAHQVQARYWGKRTPDQRDQEWAQSRRDRGQGVTGSYVLELANGSFICAEDGDLAGWCRFMNHAVEESDECNVKMFDKIVADGDVLDIPQMYAIRDIEVGDELCWDYGHLALLLDETQLGREVAVHG